MDKQDRQKHIIAIVLENEAGALSRVVGLFSQRGYNIDSLTVSTTQDSTLSRITLVTQATDMEAEQLVKQLHKLIPVLKVSNLTESAHIEREIVLVKCRADNPVQRDELKRLADIFNGQVVDVTPASYIIQLVAKSGAIDAFIETLSKVNRNNVLEMTRSGITGISRGSRGMVLS